MKLQEIKDAVAAGKTVRWANPLYKVMGKDLDNLAIVCSQNAHAIGLTHMDGVTMNGKEEDFYIEDDTRITG